MSWYFKSEDGKKNLDVMVTVSPIDVDFTGAPFVLDCSLGRDQEVRQGGFGYLCRQNEKGKGKINPEKQDQH